MAKLCEIMKELPPEFIQAGIWAKIEPRQPKRHYAESRRETTREIFRTCAGTSVRKRVRANCTPGTGSIICTARSGRYTAIACKHKM